MAPPKPTNPATEPTTFCGNRSAGRIITRVDHDCWPKNAMLNRKMASSTGAFVTKYTTGITAAPHSAVARIQNVTIVHNTIFNTPIGVRMRWAHATNSVFANNAVCCPASTAFDAQPGSAVVRILGDLEHADDIIPGRPGTTWPQ